MLHCDTLLVCPLLSFGSQVICRLGDATRATQMDSLGVTREKLAVYMMRARACYISVAWFAYHFSGRAGAVRPAGKAIAENAEQVADQVDASVIQPTKDIAAQVLASQSAGHAMCFLSRNGLGVCLVHLCMFSMLHGRCNQTQIGLHDYAGSA